MASHERFAVFPVRGLSLARDDISSQLLDRDWAVVTAHAADAFSTLFPGETSREIEVMCDRLKPDALLIVRRFMNLDSMHSSADWRKAADQAERILSALNLLLLTSPTLNPDRPSFVRMGGPAPSPVWLTWVPEHPMLPITFTRERLWTCGHSQALMWATTDSTTRTKLTMSTIDTALAASPAILSALISGDTTPSFENASKTLMLSFNATTRGQFVAQTLSSLDILFGENESAKWSDMERYVDTLCGATASPSLASSVFKMRHQFIHRHREPIEIGSQYAALAVAVNTFVEWTELLAKYGDRIAALDVLHACGHIVRAKRSGHQNIASALDLLQTSTKQKPEWISYWLTQPLKPAD
jgi:hypothetical protein